MGDTKNETISQQLNKLDKETRNLNRIYYRHNISLEKYFEISLSKKQLPRLPPIDELKEFDNCFSFMDLIESIKLYTILEGLTSLELTIIRMKYEKLYTFTEIAFLIGKSYHFVNKTHKRILQKLKNGLI